MDIAIRGLESSLDFLVGFHVGEQPNWDWVGIRGLSRLERLRGQDSHDYLSPPPSLRWRSDSCLDLDCVLVSCLVLSCLILVCARPVVSARPDWRVRGAGQLDDSQLVYRFCPTLFVQQRRAPTMSRSAIRSAKIPRKRHHISNARNAGQIPQEPVKPKPKATMRRGAPATEISVPSEMAKVFLRE